MGVCSFVYQYFIMKLAIFCLVAVFCFFQAEARGLPADQALAQATAFFPAENRIPRGLKEDIIEKFNKVKQDVADLAKKAGEVANETTKKIKDTFEDLGKKIAESTKISNAAIKKFFENIGESLKHDLKVVGDALSSVGQKIKESTAKSNAAIKKFFDDLRNFRLFHQSWKEN